MKRIGRTIAFANPPSINGCSSVVGKREGEGPLGREFDYISEDTTFGENTWEKAEVRMQKDALSRAIAKAGLSTTAVEFVFSGDLLNQCTSSAFGLREFNIPFLGLYGACSTMSEGMLCASVMIDGGFAQNVAALTSSHFCSAERQYRLPLEYGGQRSPTAQWTVTGAGAVVLSETGAGPYITHALVGKIVDMGIKDSQNMGAAMAPAAFDTLSTLLGDLGARPSDFDLIVTGDLGAVGRGLVIDMFADSGLSLDGRYSDCGIMIYDNETQDTHAGGSGCGCSAVVLAAHILPKLKAGTYKRIVFAGTGALMSPTSVQQGESIPSICHAVVISSVKGK